VLVVPYAYDSPRVFRGTRPVSHRDRGARCRPPPIRRSTSLALSPVPAALSGCAQRHMPRDRPNDCSRSVVDCGPLRTAFPQPVDCALGACPPKGAMADGAATTPFSDGVDPRILWIRPACRFVNSLARRISSRSGSGRCCTTGAGSLLRDVGTGGPRSDNQSGCTCQHDVERPVDDCVATCSAGEGRAQCTTGRLDAKGCDGPRACCDAHHETASTRLPRYARGQLTTIGSTRVPEWPKRRDNSTGSQQPARGIARRTALAGWLCVLDVRSANRCRTTSEAQHRVESGDRALSQSPETCVARL
jgi:hypothetical protein